jgi:hypothetical protein
MHRAQVAGRQQVVFVKCRQRPRPPSWRVILDMAPRLTGFPPIARQVAKGLDVADTVRRAVVDQVQPKSANSCQRTDATAWHASGSCR